MENCCRCPRRSTAATTAARRSWVNPDRPARAYCARHETVGLCARPRWCECGLHGYTAPYHWSKSGLVHGVVLAWGRIVVHDRGLRAEYGRVLALLDQPCAWFDRVVDRYCVPVLSGDELPAY